MSKKKQYKNRLPTVLPPAPRAAPESESLPPAPPAEDDLPAESAQPEVTEPEVIEPEVIEPDVIEPVPPAPLPMSTPERDAPTGSGDRSRALLVGVLLLAPLLVVGVLLASWLTSGGTGTDEDDAGPATGGEPILDAPDESYVEARVRSDGDIVVRHWIRAREPITRVVLTLPEVPGTELSAARVRVLADDLRSAGPSTLTTKAATYSFEESTDVELHYVLVGAVQRSTSATGRALAVATTLDVTYAPRPEKETRVVQAPAVLSMACADPASSTPEPCGSPQDAERWRVDLTGPDVLDRVLAQLTLEEPPTDDGEADAE